MLLKVFFLTLITVFMVSIGVSWAIVHPTRRPVNETPSTVGLEYEEVTFFSREDGLELRGWLLPSKDSDRTVIVAHGYHNNRLQDDVPALLLVKELVHTGYNVLLFDFRNCGNSPGQMTSIGQYEVRDLLGAIDFVQASPAISRRIAVLGFSMGASTAILAGVQEPAVDVIIADSPFADLKALFRTKFYPFGDLIAHEISFLTGLRPGQVSPATALRGPASKPLLIIHGDADEVIPKEHSQELLRAGGPNANLWIVPGAKHLKSYAVAGSSYSSRVIDFLNDNLR
ncbi:hypothetical protein SY88_17245 [Clostridiales bacterium PH28_bin88]|nr:hypothetical protein SY88_17245 [Clostridiales bacterium PH28_bin88]